jgi:hypothetical protein
LQLVAGSLFDVADDLGGKRSWIIKRGSDGCYVKELVAGWRILGRGCRRVGSLVECPLGCGAGEGR